MEKPSAPHTVVIPDDHLRDILPIYHAGCFDEQERLVVSRANAETLSMGFLQGVTLHCDDSAVRVLTGLAHFHHLQSLSCENTAVAALPPLPPRPEVLRISGTAITALPAPLPNTLVQILANQTPLAHVPDLSTAPADFCCDAWYADQATGQIAELPPLP